MEFMSNRYRSFILFVLAILPSALPASLTLKDLDGIVAPAKLAAPDQEAVNDLKYHLEIITGREWKVGDERKGKVIELLPLAEKESDDVWKINISADGVKLSGGSRGLGYAISLFLERHCGVKWLWPGRSGEVIPVNPGRKLEFVSEGGTPRFVRRELIYSAAYTKFWKPGLREELNLWKQRTRQANPLRTNFGHAWARIMPPAEYFSAHPEWFALVAGKRNAAQLCVSNPQLRDQFFKNFVALSDKTGLDVESISANDGYGFCECQLCLAKGTSGDAYWDFVNDMAKRFLVERPNRGVGTFAYTVGRQPPVKIEKLPPNVFLSMTGYATSMVNESGRREFKDFLQGWSSKGIRIMLREYWGMHYWLDLPALVPREIAFEIDTCANSAVVGAYGEAGKNFANLALNYYMVVQKLWDPSRPTEEIFSDFYSAFGVAGKPIRDYQETLIGAFHDYWQDKPFDGRYVAQISSYGNIFSPEILGKAGLHLAAAKAAVGEDAKLLEKIEFLKFGYDYTVVMSELLGLYEKLGSTGIALEGFEWQATARSARAHLKSPDFTENRDFFEGKKRAAASWTLEEQDQWLKRAWELGQERIRILNRANGTFALDEGLLAFANDRKIRQWHQTVSSLLGIPLESIEPLLATGNPQP